MNGFLESWVMILRIWICVFSIKSIHSRLSKLKVNFQSPESMVFIAKKSRRIGLIFSRSPESMVFSEKKGAETGYIFFRAQTQWFFSRF